MRGVNMGEGVEARDTGGAGETYLDRMVPAVRRRLEMRKKLRPLREVYAEARVLRSPVFGEAVARPGISLIAEVKRASPSKGPLRPDLDVVSLVGAYERGGARAISVLTEEDFFGGSLADLRVAVESTSLPVLRKDFIFDEYQVVEARAAGAAAVLLIAALVQDDELQGLASLANELGMGVLLEIHDASEVGRALAVPEAIIGINNRDLHTFRVSLENTVKLARLLPAGRLVVGESGIRTQVDVDRLARAGVDGVLVGETLLRQPDAEAAVAELLHPAGSGFLTERSADCTRTREDR